MKIKGIGFTLVTSLILVACGGGGGETGTPIVEAPQVQTDSLVDTVTAANYGAGSAKQDAYDYLNNARNNCGFGLLQQSSQIDTAAQAHTDYHDIHNLAATHFEDQTNFPTGFTGVTARDRIIAAGYPASAAAGSEVIGFAEALNYGTTVGRAATMNLLSLPYHGFAMLRSDRDVGVGFAPAATRLIFNFAYSADRPQQQLAGDAVATFPCDGVTDLLSRSYYNESPAPFAGRDLVADPIGHPIYLKVRDGQTLTLTSTDLRKQGSATPITTAVRTSANDANVADSSMTIVIPTTPLDQNSTYVFTYTGTNNGTAVNNSFTFNTGAF